MSDIIIYTWPLKLQNHSHYPFFITFIQKSIGHVQLELTSKYNQELAVGNYRLPFSISSNISDFLQETVNISDIITCDFKGVGKISLLDNSIIDTFQMPCYDDILEILWKGYPLAVNPGVFLNCSKSILIKKGLRFSFDIRSVKNTYSVYELSEFYYGFAYVSDFKSENYPSRRDLMSDLKNYALCCNMHWFDDIVNFELAPNGAGNLKDYVRGKQINNKYISVIYTEPWQFDKFKELIQSVSQNRLHVHNFTSNIRVYPTMNKWCFGDSSLDFTAILKNCVDFEPKYKSYNFNSWSRPSVAGQLHDKSVAILLKPNGSHGDGFEIFSRHLLQNGFFVRTMMIIPTLPIEIIKTLYNGPNYPWRADWESYLQSGQCVLILITPSFKLHNYEPCSDDEVQHTKNNTEPYYGNHDELIARVRTLILKCRKDSGIIWTRNGYHCPETLDEQQIMCDILDKLSITHSRIDMSPIDLQKRKLEDEEEKNAQKRKH